MILADTSVWIDHFRHNDQHLADLLEAGLILGHPFVVGELAVGNLQRRDQILPLLQDLPQVTVATDAEVLAFITQRKLMALGIGYIDAHLLAATRLTPGTSLWTRDKRLAAAAVRDGLAAPSLHYSNIV